MARVQKRADGCWIWLGSTHKNGYGRIYTKVRGRPDSTHRVSYELHRGSILDGMYVLHRCDVRACVNPEHLFAGTQAENIHDMYRKGRATIGKTLVDEDVRAIRRLLCDGLLQREIAERFSVTQSLISAIKLGKIWTHVL